MSLTALVFRERSCTRSWRRRGSGCVSEKAGIRVRFTVVNLTNKAALYNFLSTFSGTHFVTPRAYQVQVGVLF
jgi:hypothetical protein